MAAFKLRRRHLPLREVAIGLDLFARFGIVLHPADPAALTAMPAGMDPAASPPAGRKGPPYGR